MTCQGCGAIVGNMYMRCPECKTPATFRDFYLTPESDDERLERQRNEAVDAAFEIYLQEG